MSTNSFPIEIPENISFTDLIESQKTGARFVFYYTLFPLPWFQPVKRMSKLYYLKSDESPVKHSKKFNILNRIWGWWGIPFGPSVCYSTIKNNKSGNDISIDVFASLTESDFKNRIVTILKINDVFAPLEKDILNEIKKSFNLYKNKGGILVDSPVVGYYINTEKPYYLIGLNSEDLKNSEEILLAIQKYFYKNSKFEFIDINDENEIAQKLKSQGHKIN